MTRALPLLLFRSLHYSPNVSSHSLIWYPVAKNSMRTSHDPCFNCPRYKSAFWRRTNTVPASGFVSGRHRRCRSPSPRTATAETGTCLDDRTAFREMFPQQQVPARTPNYLNRLAGNWNFYAASIPIHTGCAKMDPMQLICHVSLSRNSTADHN